MIEKRPNEPLTLDELQQGMWRTPMGVPEVSATWVHDQLGRIRIVDVRSFDECSGPSGTIPGSEIVPMERVEAAAATWERDVPLIVSCRSGARSAHVALFLERQGFTAVASMAGGILDWRAQGY
jgi:sulfur dioxygenase